MKINKIINIEKYIDLNIQHSSNKWVSKLSIFDAFKYLNIIKNYESLLGSLSGKKSKKEFHGGPILCIAV